MKTEELIDFLTVKRVKAKRDIEINKSKSGFLKGYAAGVYIAVVSILDYIEFINKHQ